MRPQILRYILRQRSSPGLFPITATSCQSGFRLPRLLPSPNAFQARSLFIPKFFSPRKPSPLPAAPTGKATLEKLIRHLDKSLGQPPSIKALVHSFIEYIRFFGLRREPTEEDLHLLSRCYGYIQDKIAVTKIQNEGKGEETLQYTMEFHFTMRILVDLLIVLRGGQATGITLARRVFNDIVNTKGFEPREEVLLPYITALCNAGCLNEAADVCRSFASSLGGKRLWKLWDTVLLSYAKGEDEQAFFGMLQEVEQFYGDVGRRDRRLYFHIISFYCTNRNLAQAQEWYDKAEEGRATPNLPLLAIILNLCLNTGGGGGWGEEILRVALARCEGVLENNMQAEIWDLALEYMATYNGVEEVAQLLLQMQELSLNGRAPKLNVDHINLILTAAVRQNNKKLEIFCSELLKTSHLEPNLRTAELQMESCINKGDLVAAVERFENIKYTKDIPEPYIGRECLTLLRLLAQQPLPDIHRISAIYSDICSWNVHIDVDSLIALFKLYLEESSFHDVVALIKRHIGYLSTSDQDKIIEVLVTHCHRSTTSVEAVFETYMILVRLLPSISIANRERLMNLFFELNRPVTAVKVLTDMTLTEDRKPTKYQYTAALVGVTYTQNIQALEVVQRQLNMDPYVEPDTILLNALMQALSCCNLYLRAYFVYEDIARSPEGPDNTTFSIFFDLCGRDHGGGYDRARATWSRCLAQKVPLTEKNVASYVEAVARHGRWSDGFTAVKECETKLGFKPGEHLISALYTTSHNSDLAEVEGYLQEDHPEIWYILNNRLKELKRAELNNESTQSPMLSGFDAELVRRIQITYGELPRGSRRLVSFRD